jgi:hypothetical protein
VPQETFRGAPRVSNEALTIGMLSAHAALLRIIEQSMSVEQIASFLNIIQGTFGPCLTNRDAAQLLEPKGRMKSDSNWLKARNNPNWKTCKSFNKNVLIMGPPNLRPLLSNFGSLNV